MIATHPVDRVSSLHENARGIFYSAHNFRAVFIKKFVKNIKKAFQTLDFFANK